MNKKFRERLKALHKKELAEINKGRKNKLSLVAYESILQLCRPVTKKHKKQIKNASLVRVKKEIIKVFKKYTHDKKPYLIYPEIVDFLIGHTNTHYTGVALVDLHLDGVIYSEALTTKDLRRKRYYLTKR